MTVVEVLNAAADHIEHQPAYVTERDFRHGAGGAVFADLFEQARQVFGLPAVVALERHLRVDQLQHWQETDPAVVVAALRAAAKEPADPGDEVTALRRQLTELHTTLAEAAGLGPWAAGVSTSTLVREVAERLASQPAPAARPFFVGPSERTRRALEVIRGTTVDGGR